MAIGTDTERRILELRARGASYSTIATTTGVAKQTAVDVCARRKEELASLYAMELEQLHEEQRITYRERITALASLMRRTREEIERRDLTQVPTEKLIDLYIKQASALKEEMIEPNFRSREEQERDREEREYLDRLTDTESSTKVVRL